MPSQGAQPIARRTLPLNVLNRYRLPLPIVGTPPEPPAGPPEPPYVPPRLSDSAKLERSLSIKEGQLAFNRQMAEADSTPKNERGKYRSYAAEIEKEIGDIRVRLKVDADTSAARSAIDEARRQAESNPLVLRAPSAVERAAGSGNYYGGAIARRPGSGVGPSRPVPITGEYAGQQDYDFDTIYEGEYTTRNPQGMPGPGGVYAPPAGTQTLNIPGMGAGQNWSGGSWRGPAGGYGGPPIPPGLNPNGGATGGPYGPFPSFGQRARSRLGRINAAVGRVPTGAFIGALFGTYELGNANTAIDQGETNAAFAQSPIAQLQARQQALDTAAGGIYGAGVSYVADTLGLSNSPGAVRRRTQEAIGLTQASDEVRNLLFTQRQERQRTALIGYDDVAQARLLVNQRRDAAVFTAQTQVDDLRAANRGTVDQVNREYRDRNILQDLYVGIPERLGLRDTPLTRALPGVQANQSRINALAGGIRVARQSAAAEQAQITFERNEFLAEQRTRDFGIQRERGQQDEIAGLASRTFIQSSNLRAENRPTDAARLELRNSFLLRLNPDMLNRDRDRVLSEMESGLRAFDADQFRNTASREFEAINQTDAIIGQLGRNPFATARAAIRAQFNGQISALDNQPLLAPLRGLLIDQRTLATELAERNIRENREVHTRSLVSERDYNRLLADRRPLTAQAQAIGQAGLDREFALSLDPIQSGNFDARRAGLQSTQAQLQAFRRQLLEGGVARSLDPFLSDLSGTQSGLTSGEDFKQALKVAEQKLEEISTKLDALNDL